MASWFSGLGCPQIQVQFECESGQLKRRSRSHRPRSKSNSRCSHLQRPRLRSQRISGPSDQKQAISFLSLGPASQGSRCRPHHMKSACPLTGRPNQHIAVASKAKSQHWFAPQPVGSRMKSRRGAMSLISLAYPCSMKRNPRSLP